jgi:mannose-6-phosphate isomerase
MLYPLTFQPIFKERVWGGRKMAELYGKPLPDDIPVGESWEISDRPGDISVINNGPLAGKDLRWLLETHGADLLGWQVPAGARFPLLIKILDAREKLSLQVHPPADKAAALGGEPKTEMWHIVEADPDAELYVGLKPGTTRAEFETRLNNGTVEHCFHRIPVSAGDTMFLPSGRVHAIGAGLVIFEIQQNSDTTYRVFDWNRLGLDGKPRQLHLRESLESIDFQDYSPSLAPKPQPHTQPALRGSDSSTGISSAKPPLNQFTLVEDKLFNVRACILERGHEWPARPASMQIIGVISGSQTVAYRNFEQKLRPGDFCLIPASCASPTIRAQTKTEFLLITPGR